MAALARRRPFLDVFDWVDQFPPLFAARSLISPHLIRVEDKIEDGRYVIRAEMPGLDPDKDVKITVEDNTLVIDAERTEEKSDKNRSEFQYGAFRRAMALPAGAKVDDIKATYTDGILTVTIGIGETPSAQTKQIPVARG
jgi:HSP20 family molecular chaperone IbpA